MFAKLRPHHRRTSSNPTSPADPQLQLQPHPHPQSQPFEQPAHTDHAHPYRYTDGKILELPTSRSPPPPPPPPLPPLPPLSLQLQPIARVSSADRDLDGPWNGIFTYSGLQPGTITTITSEKDPYSRRNHGRMLNAASPRTESAGMIAPTSHHRLQHPRAQAEMKRNPESPRLRSDTSPGFVTSPGLAAPSIQGVKKSQTSSFSLGATTLIEPIHSKSRLNKLNPMSLLARRKASPAMPQLAPQSLVSSKRGKKVTETFDPRIRGTLVHDFSAPRPRKKLSNGDLRQDANSAQNLRYQRSPNGDPSNAGEDVTSPWSGGNHTPVFTENFEEEQYPHAGPHVRKASDLTDLPLPQPPYARGLQKSPDPKSTDGAQKQPHGPTRPNTQKPAPDCPPLPLHPPPVPLRSDGPSSVEPRRVSIDPASAPPKAGSRRSRPRSNVSEVSIKDAAALPKHMRSTSSRFSFDMVGAAKQEKLLEERHRKKAQKKEAETLDGGDGRLEDERGDDDYYDHMEDDDGLEEWIPGLEVADEEDYPYDHDDLEEPIPMSGFDEGDAYPDSGILGGFTFQHSLLPAPLSPKSPAIASTPRDEDGAVIGFAMSKNSPWAPDAVESGLSPSSPLPYGLKATGPVQGLGLQGMNTRTADATRRFSPVDEFPRPPALDDDDDLYFDDGIIGEPGDGDNHIEFDESVFDNIDTDQYGRPLKPLPSLPAQPLPLMLAADLSSSFQHGTLEAEDMIDPASPILPTSGRLAPKPSISGRGYGSSGSQGSEGPLPLPTQTLTRDTLAAYQSALAEAAFAAAANGKFRRDSTNTSEQEDSQPGLINDSGQTSHCEPFSPPYDKLEDDFDYDDVLEDDPIIAAANAEALANDDDGFYGHEFGFYSAPAEGNNQIGGFFGLRGLSGVARGLSNRVVSREPNLTPITERSEYSNRNSFMSLAMHPPGSMPSPGLAQLTNMLRTPGGDYDNADISFEALLKLRARAWGGSQASQHSSGGGGSPKSTAGMDDGPPSGAPPPLAQAGAVSPRPGSGSGHQKNSKTFSFHSECASATSSPPASPTLATAFPPLDGIAEKSAKATEKNMGFDTGR
ncbi:uncharacterized protein L3040_008110 [Drepanopeziza brunnea f. sp. 'multigermtubi']|uniref:uncharacterized protein n=1 Tax=Drepanopeziza brunnea f. sp. 'multigermtubi' TaxID=698441 RepID=UPI0023990C27|nr:hypothetical protein L3040_008110 [Drepanopeziza brunnea f. sp. 'multigermtubi']